MQNERPAVVRMKHPNRPLAVDRCKCTAVGRPDAISEAAQGQRMSSKVGVTMLQNTGIENCFPVVQLTTLQQQFKQNVCRAHRQPRGGARVHFKIAVCLQGWATFQTPHMRCVVPRCSAQVRYLARSAKFNVVNSAGIMLLGARQTQGTDRPSLETPHNVGANGLCDEENEGW